MKIIVQILSGITPDNLTRNLEDLQGQLDYYSKHKTEVEGTSLITIKDKLALKYTDEVLRNNGYILTLAQFKEDCEKYLELASKDPIRYNSRLKRLHYGFELFQDNYIKGNVYNQTVYGEMSKHFNETITYCYSQGHSLSLKMPEELTNRIAKMIEIEIERLNKDWLDNKTSATINKEFNDYLVTYLLDAWRTNKLDATISNQLKIEKSKINSVGALLTHFRGEKLPEAIQKDIFEAIVTELSREINARKISPHSDLGAAIKYERHNTLFTDDSTPIANIISNWQNKQTSVGVARELEKYVSKVLDNMQADLESRLTQEFDQLAIRNFIEILQWGQYSKDMTNLLAPHTLKITKELCLSSHDANNPSVCRMTVINTIMDDLHGYWIGGKLSEQEDSFIKKSVFASLKQLDITIQEKVWPNKGKDYSALLEANASLRSQVENQSKLLEKLMTQVELLCRSQNNTEVEDKTVHYSANFFK